jgi:phosphoenolpyruvate synthase/pyruvate phosphate dikinase
MRLEICKVAEKGNVQSSALKSLVKKFGWYGEYSFVEPLYDESYFASEIKKLSKIDAKNEISKIIQTIKTNKEKFAQVLKEIKSSELRHIAIVINEYTCLRTRRIEELKKAQVQVRALYSSVGNELNKNISSEWTYGLIPWLTNAELLEYFSEGVVPDLNSVKKRMEVGTAFIYDGKLKITSTKDPLISKILEHKHSSEESKYSLWGTRFFGMTFAQSYFEYTMKFGAKEMYIACIGGDKADYVVKLPEFDDACIKMGLDYLKNAEKLESKYPKIKKKILAFAIELSKKAGKVKDTKLNELFTEYLLLVDEYGPYWMFPHYSERVIEPLLRQKYPKYFELITSLPKPTEHMLMQKALFEKSSKQVAKEFCWLSVISMAEKPFDEKYFINYKKSLNKKQVFESFKKIKSSEVNFKKILKKLEKKDQELAKLLHEYVFMRTDRIDFWKRQSFELYPFIEYVARKISPVFGIREGSMLSYQEISKILSGEKCVSPSELKQRGERKVFSITFTQTGISFHYDEEYKQKVLSLYKNNTPDAEIKGVIACKGLVKGKVKLYLKHSDIKDSDKGYVLVCGHTTPQDVPIMKRAIAIVTNEGGVTSHAAIVSRELGIPCITGTKNATKLIKGGDLVEVDANKGIVKIIKLDGV